MQLYSTEDAAAYLGLKPETVKHHIYKSKRLAPQLVGGAYVFTQSQLDEFKRSRTGPGRPVDPNSKRQRRKKTSQNA